MTPDAMLAELIAEQAEDDGCRWAKTEAGFNERKQERRRFTHESAIGPGEADRYFDRIVDLDADPVAEAIAHERLSRWAAEDEAPVRGWPPTRARETIGLGVTGWQLETEAAALLGRPCPVCGDHPGPGEYCLACCRTSPRFEEFLARLRRLDGELPAAWRSIETEPERAALADASGRHESSLAERRFASREASRRSLGPPRAKPNGKVRMVNSMGGARMVRPSLVGAYQAAGWRPA